MKKRLWTVLGVILTAVVSISMLAGCSSTDAGTVDDEDQSTTIVVTDQTGRTITLDSIPERIVSLAPSNTEILYSLGLEDKLVGVTEFCNYPAAALDKPKVGGYSDVDIEKIIAADPDVIFGTNIHEDETLPKLEELGLTVVILDPRSMEDVLDSFGIVGQITGTEAKAAEVVAGMSARIKAITDKTDDLSSADRLRVFYVIWHEPMMTVGGDTRISEMIEKAGGVNMFVDTEGYPEIDLETLVEGNPQVIIAGSGMGEGADAPFIAVNEDSRLADCDARKNGMVYQINTDLTGRPTERMIDGLEQLAAMIHPELFD